MTKRRRRTRAERAARRMRKYPGITQDLLRATAAALWPSEPLSLSEEPPEGRDPDQVT